MVDEKDPTGLVTGLAYNGHVMPVPCMKTIQTRQLGTADKTRFTHEEIQAMIWLMRKHKDTGDWIMTTDTRGNAVWRRQDFKRLMHGLTEVVTRRLPDDVVRALGLPVKMTHSFLKMGASPFMPEDALEEFSGRNENERDYEILTLAHDRDGNELRNITKSVKQQLTLAFRTEMRDEEAVFTTRELEKGVLAHQISTEWQEAARTAEETINNTYNCQGKRSIGFPNVSFGRPKESAQSYQVIGNLNDKFDQGRIENGVMEVDELLGPINSMWAVQNMCFRFHLMVEEANLIRPYNVPGDSRALAEYSDETEEYTVRLGDVVNHVQIVFKRE